MVRFIALAEQKTILFIQGLGPIGFQEAMNQLDTRPAFAQLDTFLR